MPRASSWRRSAEVRSSVWTKETTSSDHCRTSCACWTAPGWVPRTPRAWSRASHPWLYVVAGRVRLLLAEHDITLGPGEAAEFDTRVPHRFGPAGDQPVEILSLPGRQGERIHVRAAPRPETDGQRSFPRNHHTGHQVM